jgi:hypothetical protein
MSMFGIDRFKEGNASCRRDGGACGERGCHGTLAYKKRYGRIEPSVWTAITIKLPVCRIAWF